MHRHSEQPSARRFRHNETASRPGKSAGFSLVEVLIALGLSLLLMASVYAAIDLLFRYQTAGRARMQRNQIVRALIRRMNEDIGSIVMQLPEEEQSSSSDVEDDDSTGSETSPLTTSGFEDLAAPITFGLVGDPISMHMSVSKPNRELSYTAVFGEDLTAGQTSDLMTATYGLAPVVTTVTDTSLSMLTSGGQVVTSSEHQPDTGFGRRLISLYAMEQSEESLGAQDLLAPEISEVQFRYFDGAEWLDEWDSRTLGQLPLAIEVTFGFWVEPPKTVGSQVNYVSEVEVMPVMHVFHVPLSVPEAVF